MPNITPALIKAATKSELLAIVGALTRDHLMELRVTGMLRKLKSQGDHISTDSPSELVNTATEVELRAALIALCDMGPYINTQVINSFGVLERQPYNCRNCGKTFCEQANKANSCHYHPGELAYLHPGGVRPFTHVMIGPLLSFKHHVDIYPRELRYWNCCRNFEWYSSGCKVQKHQC